MNVITYNECLTCGTSEDIVQSGVDAFVLGIIVGTSCYTCANGNYEYEGEAL